MATYTDQLVVYDSGLFKKIAAGDIINIDNLVLPDGGLTLNATAVSSTAAELNLLDGSSAGTIVNSKVVVYGSSGEVNATTLQIGGTSITATAAEINYLDISTLGTAAASKALVADGSAQIDANAITFTDLGTVTTVDLNGGTIDGVTIGGSSAGAGTFTTLDCNNGAFSIDNLDIDGGTDIGADLVDADLLIVDDGAAGTNRKTALSRFKTYIQSSTLTLSGDNTFSGSNTFENATGQIIQGDEGNAGSLYLKADQGDDAGDSWKLSIADGGTFTFGNDIAVKGTYVTHLTLTPNATVSSSTAAFAGHLTVAGDLTVNGTTTTVNSTTVTVDDKNLELGSVATPTDTTADGGGITLKGATDKTINWVNATDSWTLSEHVDLASGKEFKINNTSVLSATTLGSGVTGSSLTSVGTLTSLTVNGNIVVSDGTNDLNIASHDGSNGLQLAGTLVTADANELNILDGATVTASELNLLDGDTAVGSSITIADTDGLVINDNGTMKTFPASDLKNYINASAAGSVAADDIIAGDAAVEITTTTGDVVIDAPTSQSVDLQVNGSNVVEVAGGRVDVSQPLILGSNAGLSLTPASSHAAFVVGNILAFENDSLNSSRGLELADADGGGDYLNVPIGVALETSAQDNTNAIMVHTVHGSKVTVKIGSTTTNPGEWVYLDGFTAGQATLSAPTSGFVYRLGITTTYSSEAVTSTEIIWMPQFIADLG